MKRMVFVLVISLTLASLVALAGASNGLRLDGGWPIMLVCAAWAFAFNWLMFIPAAVQQTERFYDLTGSLTYLSMIGLAVYFVPYLDVRAKVMAALVVIWAVRLGSFLFRRILQDGKDDRFDEIKANPARFFSAWTLQGLWVFLTAACVLTVITSNTHHPFGLWGAVGLTVWLFGFAVEVIADWQKSRFKGKPENSGKFIQTGLWAWSRHPNYFGEMTLWTGVAIMSLPVLTGWQWFTLISPVFVFVLINYVTGVNKLEAKAEKYWGSDPEYQSYKARTSVLILSPPKKARDK